MDINWKIRFKNPLFFIQTFGAIILPVLVYYNIQFSDITTWDTLFYYTLEALKNPFVVGNIVFAIFNAVTDPTTSGISDNNRVLSYKELG